VIQKKSILRFAVHEILGLCGKKTKDGGIIAPDK
jgi:hypothetical protein